MTVSRARAPWPLGWACPSPDDMTGEAFEVLLDAVADAGFAGIEPMIAGPYRCDAQALKRALRLHSLKMIGLRTGGLAAQHGLTLAHIDPEVRSRAVAAVCEVIRFASSFGQPRILVGLMQGRLVDGVTLADAQEWIVDGLAQAAQVALPLGIEIDLEPINRYLVGYHTTVEAVLPIVTRIGSPNVRLLLDSYHMHLEESSIAGAVVQAGRTIGHVHVADSNRRAPGEGHFSFPELFGVLKAVGYSGTVTVECDYLPDQVTSLRTAARYLTLWCGNSSQVFPLG
jgi:sugar phosphate isomerase/epimerase